MGGWPAIFSSGPSLPCAEGARQPRVSLQRHHAQPRVQPARQRLNPKSTLDNRVSNPSWTQVQVPMIRLDDRLSDLKLSGPTFYKVDTQGFELHVLRGLESTLSTTQGWKLKMEFAPDWLLSQGTQPEDVLDHLQARYEFVEYPERIVYGTQGLDALFAQPVRPQDHADFIRHVVSLNRNGLGWVDLLVRPRPR